MIYIFNGPPGSGKDEVCQELVKGGFTQASFKEQLITDALEEFGVTREWFLDGYDDRSIKERPEEALRGLSRRQALIHTSENVKKVQFGQEYFGKAVAKKLNPEVTYCISDGGFVEELYPLIEAFGADNIVIVQLYREGCTYANDSRYYVKGHLKGITVCGTVSMARDEPRRELGHPVKTYELHNNGTLDELHQAVAYIIRESEKGQNA